MGLGVGAAVALLLPDDLFGVPEEAAPPPDSVRTEAPPLDPVFDGADADREQLPVTLVPLAEELGQPTDLAFVPGHPDKFVVTSKWGTVHLVDLETSIREYWLWLDVSDILEFGVLGLAFHTDFEDNGRFFVHHSPTREDGWFTVLTEFRVDPESLDRPRKVADLLEIEQPERTHNGGQLAMGPDGHLYMAVGDGEAASEGDPHRNGQNRGTMLGALLRLDVSRPGKLDIPDDNPFVDDESLRPELFAYGLRNPWRFTFDPDGRAVVADVGHATWEEINIVASGDNLGWSVREGRDCFRPTEGCETEGFVEPIYVYGHEEGISITGGHVWTAPGDLQGRYVFGDFGTGRLWALTLPDEVRPTEEVVSLGRFDISPSAFGRDARGRIWVADFRSERVYRIDPR
ncbi:MAG: PQQ-dependent sugar dehydrogenase [Myxococcota bacterium]